MTATTERPKLRNIEAIRYRANGQDMFCLRDPYHLSDLMLHVSPEVFVIACMLDGSRDIREIQAEFMRRFGVLVRSEDVQKVIDGLEQAHFLEGASFEDWRRQVEEGYRALPVRAPILAGSCYPEDRRDIGGFLDRFFTAPGGPAMPAPRAENAAPVRALVVPHIDLRRGGTTYAHGYKALAEAAPPEVVVVLGVAHAGRGGFFTLTRKDFETPLGTLKTDAEVVARLGAALGERAFADEFAHKGEHSIEIQAVWLQHLWPDRPPRLVPVLCGSFHELLASGTSPRSVDEVARMIGELGALLHEGGGKVTLLASADLAHIGAKFGDRVPLTERLLRKNEELDRQMLELVQAGDADGFFDFVRREEDRRKICGLVPIYATLAALEVAAGAKVPMRLLNYAQSVEEATQSLVSFAALAEDRAP